MLVEVPTTRPSLSATKHPSGLAERNRTQSALVWFHPAASFNCIASGMSSMVIKRNRTLMGLPWIPGDARGTTRHLVALDDGTQAPSDNPEVNAGSHTLHASTGEMIQSGECTVAFQPS